MVHRQCEEWGVDYEMPTRSISNFDEHNARGYGSTCGISTVPPCEVFVPTREATHH